MAVVSTRLLFTGRGGRDTFEHHRTYTREYEVITDDLNDDESVVGNDPGIPLRGTTADFDDEAFVVSVDVQQSNDSMLIWYVSVEYDSEPPFPQAVDIEGNPVPGSGGGSGTNVEFQDNPLNEPATWKITTMDSEEPAIEGRPVDGLGEITLADVTAWVANTAYTRGALVSRVGNVYKQVSPVLGVEYISGPTGPSGTGNAIADNPTAWAPTTAYNFGDVRKNGDFVYRCQIGGTSAGAGGPTGTEDEIVDGTVTWAFYGVPAIWAYQGTLNDLVNNPNADIYVPIHNSANHPFDPPPMVEVSRGVLTVTKNMTFASLAYIMSLKNAVNVIAWKGVPPRCAKILKVEHDGGKFKNGIVYVTTTWEIGLDPDTWDLRVLDCGYQGIEKRTPPGGGAQVETVVRFKDVNGDPVTEPVPMDGAGKRLPVDAQPVFLRFVPRQQRVIDFNSVLPF